MSIKLHDKVYDWLKWLCLIALPALSVLYSAVAAIWGLPYADRVAQTVNGVVAFIGALIGLSTSSYKCEDNTVATVASAEGGKA